MAPILPLELYIAWRYVRSNPKQSLIVMLAVGIGVSLIVFIPAVNESFYGRMMNRAVEKSPQIVITREIKTRARNEELLQQTYPEQEAIQISDKTLSRKRNIKAYRLLMEDLQTIPGVTQTAPFVTEQVIAVRGSKVQGADLRGIIPNLEDKLTKISQDVQRGDLDTLSGDQAFLGWRLAEELGVTTGSRIQLVTSRGTRSFKVAGILNSGLEANDLRTILTDIKAAQRLLNMSNEVTGIGVRVSDPYQSNVIAERIAARFNLKAKSWMEENKLLLDELENFRFISAFINFLIVFAAASSISSVLIMVVSSKAKEIGILKAMGTSPGQIVRLFMFQAVFLSLLGAFSGVVIGIGLVELYNASPMATAETAWGFKMEPAGVDPSIIYSAFGYSLVSSFIASLIPAWQAGKLDPIKAINQ